jgi:hypothetical protein
MKNSMLMELIRFTLDRPSGKERARYLLMAIIFYPMLFREGTGDNKSNESAVSSQAGDDIYPLF